MTSSLKLTAPFLFVLLLANLCACTSNKTSQKDPYHGLVDSLIQVHRINKQTLMLSFGAESVSAIQTDKGIVVIDAGISTGLTQLFRKLIEHEFKGCPFAYVLNTHAHHDHCRGNSVFPEAEIVGQVNGIKFMDDQWKDPKRMQDFLKNTAKDYESRLNTCIPHSEEWYNSFQQFTRYQQAYRDAKELIPIRKPTMVFADDYVIDMGNATFDLKYFGQCHSNSDILIHVPELKLLFTGDLMFEYGRPSIRDTTMAEQEIWYGSLAWIDERMAQIDKVIGGHGQLLSSDDLKAFVGTMNNMLAQNNHEITP